MKDTQTAGVLAGLAGALAAGTIEVVDLTHTLDPDFPVIVLPPEFGQAILSVQRAQQSMRGGERAPRAPALCHLGDGGARAGAPLERAAEAEVRGREGIRLAHAERDVVSRPRPDPVDRGQRRDELLERHAAVEPDLVPRDRACEAADGLLPGAREAEAFEVGVGEHGRGGKRVREPEL